MAREPIKLTAKDKKALLDLQEDIIWLGDEIEKAKRAGIDTSELEANYQKSVKLREGLLREYG